MKTFPLTLLDSRGSDRFSHVRQFIGADGSGAFGVLAGHEAMVAALRYGLARFEDEGGNWHYAAMPGGILHFRKNTLNVVTVRYFLGENADELAERLTQEMSRDDSELVAARQTLAKIDRTLVRRLTTMGLRGGAQAGGIWP